MGRVQKTLQEITAGLEHNNNIENVDKISEMTDEIDVSKAMIYRALIELKNKGFIEENTDKGYKLTEAGRIAKM